MTIELTEAEKKVLAMGLCLSLDVLGTDAPDAETKHAVTEMHCRLVLKLGIEAEHRDAQVTTAELGVKLREDMRQLKGQR